MKENGLLEIYFMLLLLLTDSDDFCFFFNLFVTDFLRFRSFAGTLASSSVDFF